VKAEEEKIITYDSACLTGHMHRWIPFLNFSLYNLGGYQRLENTLYKDSRVLKWKGYGIYK
jgi:hypothetical protein